jgi:hypothetical protein
METWTVGGTGSGNRMLGYSLKDMRHNTSDSRVARHYYDRRPPRDERSSEAQVI